MAEKHLKAAVLNPDLPTAVVVVVSTVRQQQSIGVEIGHVGGESIHAFSENFANCCANVKT